MGHKNLKMGWTGLSVGSLLLVGVGSALVYSKVAKNENSARELQNLSVGETPKQIDDFYMAHVYPGFQVMNFAMAAEGGEGNSECNAKAMTAWSSCFSKNTKYLHGALNFFNNTLCILNQGFPSQVETSLCHFSKSMGMNPDKSALPVTVEKTFGSKTIKLVVEKPSETFAVSAGYDAKGTVTVDGTTFMVLYWGGTSDSTKGFMISGAAGMGSESKKHPSYIYWDRTSADAQFVKVFVTNFETAYLTSFSSPSQDNPQGGDRALYGEATYNSTTKSITTQTVSIESRRDGAGTSAGCFKMFATGTKGGTISVAKTDNSHGSTGNSVSDATTDGTDMDAAVLADSESTANGTGNFSTPTAAGMSVTFKKSCSDVNSAGGSGKAFASNDVNFSATTSDIFQ